jgi:hypothetical protein
MDLNAQIFGLPYLYAQMVKLFAIHDNVAQMANYIVRAFSVPDFLPYKGSIPIFSNVRKQKEKRLKNKETIFLFATQSIRNRYID